jgi:uracil phosphoribosyltransferase
MLRLWKPKNNYTPYKFYQLVKSLNITLVTIYIKEKDEFTQQYYEKIDKKINQKIKKMKCI